MISTKTHIVHFRGVIPIGKNKVPMAELREALSKTCIKDVRTYIVSGNALVDSSLAEAQIATRVHDLIK